MLRIENRTKLAPEQAIERAATFFKNAGLSVKYQVECEVVLEGGGGGVDLAARSEAGATIVEGVSREWDEQLKEFMRTLR